MPLVSYAMCLQVLYSYSIGFIYILTGLLCVGGLGPAVAFCSEVRPQKLQRLLVLNNIPESIINCNTGLSLKGCFFSSLPPRCYFTIRSLRRSEVTPYWIVPLFVVSAPGEDVWLCILLLSDGLFWHLLCAGVDQAVWSSGGSNR